MSGSSDNESRADAIGRWSNAEFLILSVRVSERRFVDWFRWGPGLVSG